VKVWRKMLVLSVLIVGIAMAAGSDDLLRKYEASERKFEKFEIGDKIVYFHQNPEKYEHESPLEPPPGQPIGDCGI